MSGGAFVCCWCEYNLMEQSVTGTLIEKEGKTDIMIKLLPLKVGVVGWCDGA